MSGGGGGGRPAVVKAPEPSFVPGASYTPIASNVYKSAFSSAPSNQVTGDSPLVSQLKAQQVSPFQQAGLQAMFGALQQPSQGLQGLMPSYRPQALSYRPDMQGILANLQRVSPSVELQQRLKAEEDARRAADEANRPIYGD